MRRIEVVAHLGERAGAQLDEGRVGNGAHGADRGAGHGRQAAGGGILALGGESTTAQVAGPSRQAAPTMERTSSTESPRRARRHHVGMRAHCGQHDRDGDGHPRHALRQRAAVIGLAGHDEVRHGNHHEHHDRDELLRNAGGDVAEAVEDALPVLQVEEHGDAAGGRRSTQDRIASSCWDFLPAPLSASTPAPPNTPQPQAVRVVNKIRGHCSSMIYSSLANRGRAGCTRSWGRCPRPANGERRTACTPARIPSA